MSYSASGHIAEGHGDQTPENLEAELTVRLHEVLTDPKYGCTTASLYGQYAGTVNLLAAAGDENDPKPDDEPENSAGPDPAED
jgi:hypothetical protein